MKLSILIISALRNLKRNRKRSFLTMLGIIIGIAAVITITALGEGYKNRIIEDFTGENNGKVQLKAMFITKDEEKSNRSINNFDDKDKKTLEDLKEVKSVGYIYSSSNYSEFIDFQIRGNNFQGVISKVKKTELHNIAGRNLNEKDNEYSTRCVVINEDLIKNTFKEKEKLIGGIATINGINFEIVGIVENSFDLESDIQIPENTYEKFFKSSKVIQGLSITLNDGENVEESINKIEGILNDVGTRRTEGSYTVMDSNGMIKIMGTVLNSLTLFISGVAGISLFIAGIGVMNMVYTSVYERTAEIGIKRSIGASRSDIRKEFLIEGITITITGGAIGYIIGMIFSNIISAFMNMIIMPSLLTVSIAIITSILIGVISSVVPANKAALANTIDILK